MDGVIRAGQHLFLSQMPAQPFVGVYKEPYCVDLYKAPKYMPQKLAELECVEWACLACKGVDGECANCHRSVLSEGVNYITPKKNSLTSLSDCGIIVVHSIFVCLGATVSGDIKVTASV